LLLLLLLLRLCVQVVVLDGVAYHQGTQGVRVLEGSERTPFMTVTVFSKARSKQVGGHSVWRGWQSC
jgi:alpha-acetolactate decarboxylase